MTERSTVTWPGRPAPQTCTPTICTLTGVPMSQHRPDCPLRGFERDHTFGGEPEPEDEAHT